MGQKNQLTIKEFARLTGIKRENLRFYDRIGLLSPETRGAQNHYRYYSKYQVNKAFLISSLRGLGVGIESIRNHVANSTSENTLTLFEQQDLYIQQEIQQLQEMRSLLHLYARILRDAVEQGEEAVFLEEKPDGEPIFLCPLMPDDMDGDEGVILAYNYAEENGINLGLPCGTVIPRKKIGTSGVTTGGSGFFKLDKQSLGRANAGKPAGLYAVIYGTCDTWNIEPLYERLLEFVKEQGLEIDGDAYEEYLMGSSASDSRESCTRIEVPVIRPD